MPHNLLRLIKIRNQRNIVGNVTKGTKIIFLSLEKCCLQFIADSETL